METVNTGKDSEYSEEKNDSKDDNGSEDSVDSKYRDPVYVSFYT